MRESITGDAVDGIGRNHDSFVGIQCLTGGFDGLRDLGISRYWVQLCVHVPYSLMFWYEAVDGVTRLRNKRVVTPEYIALYQGLYPAVCLGLPFKSRIEYMLTYPCAANVSATRVSCESSCSIIKKPPGRKR